MKILALASYPSSAAATRFRLTQFSPYFEAMGWELEVVPFLSEREFRSFYSPQTLRRSLSLLRAVVRRIRLALSRAAYAGLLVQREAAILGPPVFEYLLSEARHRPLVFDFDDALWHLDLARSRNPLATRLLRSTGKVWWLIRRAALVIAGSSFLAESARKLNRNVQVFPTVVRADAWVPLACRSSGEFARPGPPIIGWVGTHSTAHQLELVAPALRRLRSEGREFVLRVVGAASDFALPGLVVENVPWTLASDVELFQRIDIGLAPMHRAPVYEGKCGFKQLQYMAVGVPCVTSWVGGARDFVRDGANALVAQDSDGWYRHLRALLDDASLRMRLASAGRAVVENDYCTERQGPKLAQLVCDTVGRG